MGFWVSPAAAKIGASVDTDPSIRPSSAGCTFWRTKTLPMTISSADFVKRKYLSKTLRSRRKLKAGDENLHGLIFRPLAGPHQILPIRRNYRKHIGAGGKRDSRQAGSIRTNHVNLVIRVIRSAVGEQNMFPVR